MNKTKSKSVANFSSKNGLFYQEDQKGFGLSDPLLYESLVKF